MPKPDVDLCMHVDLPLNQKKKKNNQDWANGPPGRWASRPRGCRGPWAAGRWAFGSPGRHRPWATGLLSAKPGG